MTSNIGLNWKLIYERKIKHLKKLYIKIYDENQKMKRRLEKYEKTKRAVRYWNQKEKNEDNNIRTTGNREDNNVVEPSRRVHTARN
jgi:acyl-[acyl carrier protein]--UDP-N-acetylglucosamine O-acyltransferase